MMNCKFDLNVHTVEDIPGRMLELHGAEYIFQELLAEGGQKFVYPLKNKESGLILYVAKIYKFRLGSSELQRMLSYTPKIVFDLISAKLGLYTEFHEIPGAMMQLQPYGIQTNQEYWKHLMDFALNLQSQQKWSEANTAYNEVFKNNPNHTEAMLNKGICLINLGEIQAAVDLIQKSINIEPNFPESYRLLSSIFLYLGQPEVALIPLKKTLTRFSGDPETWAALLRIAIDYDFAEIAKTALQEVKLLSRDSGIPSEFVCFADSIDQSIKRKSCYSDLLSKAKSLQMKNQWREALVLCKNALSVSKNNKLARLNLLICKYHLGEEKEITEEILSTINQLTEPELGVTVLLGLLCCYISGQQDIAKQLALWLASTYDNSVDIPSIPVAISDFPYVLETRSSSKVINVLASIEKECSPTDALKISNLKSLYLKRENDFCSESCETNMEPGPYKDSNAHLAAGTPPDLLGLCLHDAIACHETSIENEMLRKRYADDTQTIRRIIWKGT